jgi:hypothetical protein
VLAKERRLITAFAGMTNKCVSKRGKGEQMNNVRQ